MTLLEVMVSVVLLSIAGAAVLPVMDAAARLYAESAGTRGETGRLRYAMDRIVRVLREAPAGATPGSIGLSRLYASAVEFEDGAGLALEDGVLRIRHPDLGEGVLLTGVVAFSIVALDEDGARELRDGDAARADRFRVTLATGRAELRTAVFPRVRMTR
jgi:hypothetical protein